MENEETVKSLNFIEQIIDEEIKSGIVSEIHTRFPPEPNGYLHIGHAKSICLNFGLAEKFNGKCNLRFDDTNPEKEDVEYVDSIMEDVKWLGFNWADKPYYASDYFEQLYQWAVLLIQKGKAYVCDMTADEISSTRGTPTQPGTPSPGRNRSIEENLNLFERMKNGEFRDEEKVLRAKIDMASPNMHMRDPVIYRIKHVTHHRTGNKWCIYPMYDFAHGQSDYIEGITHSICTLEFEVHRPLYYWFLDNILDEEKSRPKQIEFARLNMNYTIMSKRYLHKLVKEGFVSGWDDPRMPTISGLRRRGYTPESIRNFTQTIGVARRDMMVDMALLEFCVREDLNKKSQRIMGVLNPLKLVIDNYPEDKTEEFDVVNNQEDESKGKRKVPFSNNIYIEREDFMEEPVKGFFRLAPGREVRLRAAYLITCDSVVKNAGGEIIELHCTCDLASRGGDAPDGRKVKGTLHWVSAQHAVDAEIRLYDRLFVNENPYETEDGKDFTSNINKDSLRTITGKLEPFISNAKSGDKFQFERQGYFCVDPDSITGHLVFNRTVTLKDTWTKSSARNG